ncbi:MAG: class I SAM-dependent methyltransferase [Acidimicrobiales bacterium]
MVHPAYDNPRDEVTALIPRGATRILDVGCSTGAMGASLVASGHEVTGIEHSPELAARARKHLTHVLEADIEVIAGARSRVGGPYDCVVLADVLEHLRNPWAVTRWAAEQLVTGGCLVISVPNIRHARLVRWVLLKRCWPYEEVGIFDRTHLRFFAFRNLGQLLEGTGLEISELRRSYALSMNPNSSWNRLAPHLGDLGTLQFVFRAQTPERPDGCPHT